MGSRSSSRSSSGRVSDSRGTSSATRRRLLRGGFGVTKNMIPSSGLISGAANNNPPNQFRPQIFYGTLDTFLDLHAACCSRTTSRRSSGIRRVPTVYSWTLGAQRDLGASTSSRPRICGECRSTPEPAAQSQPGALRGAVPAAKTPIRRIHRRRSRTTSSDPTPDSAI